MFNFKKPTASLFSHQFLYLSLFLVPFQIIKFPDFIFASTQLDISTFFLMVSLALSLLCNKISKSFMASLFLFIIFETIIFFYFSFQSSLRFFYFLVVYSLYLSIYFLTNNYNLDRKKLFNITLFGLIFSGVIALFQALNSDFSLRPKGLMLEPTFSGLLFYSASFAAIGAILIKKSIATLTSIFYSLFFLLCAMLTKSMHVISFFILVTLFNFFLLAKRKFNGIALFKNILIALGFLFFINFIDKSYLPNFLERVNFLGAYQNLSYLSYKACFDEMLRSISLSPFFGISVGASGKFAYTSMNESLIFLQLSYNSNSTDGYSLIFRLIIELGIITSLIIVTFLILKAIFFLKSEVENESYKSIFLFLYSFSIIFFCFIKGSSLTHGYLFVYSFIFLYITKPLKSNL